jgi:hypothetical protein
MHTFNDIRLWHLRNKSTHMALRTLVLLMLAIGLWGCETPVETVSIDETYWSAYRNPESFDAYLDTAVLEPRTANCFFRHRDAAVNNLNAKLRECSVILQGSPAWNDCHDEADAFETQAVIFQDIGNTVAGTTTFDVTQAYTYLMLSKSLLNPADWEIFIDQLNELTPPFYCEYEGEEQWIWE